MTKWRWARIMGHAALAATVVIAALQGCSSGGPVPSTATPTPSLATPSPVAPSPTATPTPVPTPVIVTASVADEWPLGDEWQGGEVTFSVVVANLRAGDVVRMVIEGPEEQVEIVTLTSSDAGTYTGRYTVPANVGTQDCVYHFAAEIIRNEGVAATSDAGTVTVPYAEPPQP